MKVYFISGLGADKSVFHLLDLSYCQPVFLDWIKPQHNEPLQQYALRLKEAYNIPDNAVIVGLSFGGMLATEIAKAFPRIKAIIISSSKTKFEIPALYKIGKYLPIYKWLPGGLQRQVMCWQERRFGVTSPEGKKIYRHVIKQADIGFNDWAIWALLHWNNVTIPPNVIHIHGTADKILPYRLVRANITVNKGGHLMVMENAAEISAILKTQCGIFAP